MSKLSNAVKKIVKHKDFKWLVLIQVGVLMIVAVLFLIMPKPISRYQTYSERVYSPSFRMDTYKTGRFNSHIASDIINGYNLLGYNIQKQITDIIKYENDYDRQILEFGNMTDEQVNKWCYYDLKKRGAIG